MLNGRQWGEHMGHHTPYGALARDTRRHRGPTMSATAAPKRTAPGRVDMRGHGDKAIAATSGA